LHAEAAPKGVRVQAVLPGATRTQFFNRFGISIDERFSPDKIMEPTDLVDAALAGFDQGELVTRETADPFRFAYLRKCEGNGSENVLPGLSFLAFSNNSVSFSA
jgi:short-subunit dehydrogenase